MTSKRFCFQTVMGLFICAMFLLSGCSGGTEVGNPSVGMDFTSDAELHDYFVEQYASGVSSSSNILYASAEDGVGTDGADQPEKGSFSTTNIQEAGVDEGDVVKTDGDFLYIASKNHVKIVAARPGIETNANDAAGSRQISVDGDIDELYLYGHLLVIIYTPENNAGTPWNGADSVDPSVKADFVGIPYWIPVNARVGILFVDVSNPDAPETIKKITADGRLSGSRRIEGRLHVILQYLPVLPPIHIWYDGTEKNRENVISENRLLLADMPVDAFLPKVTVTGAADAVLKSGRLVPTPDFLRPDPASGGGIVTVLTQDLDDPSSDFSSIGFIADVGTVYASTRSLYLVDTDYPWTIDWLDTSGTADFVTHIHMIDLTGEKARLVASGTVPGEVINQFSLGEYQGVLRVATSTGTNWNTDKENHVFCLKPDGTKLAVIGRLDGIAPGEDLYAARFMGTRGFLVTFVKVDPLFTLDLSDPKNPKVAGELTVPGYSTYLHPMSDDLLLAMGKDARVEDGITWYQGLQLSIFDISDFSAPELLFSEHIGARGTGSEALYDHKAFTWFSEKGLLAIPVNLYEHLTLPDQPWEWGTHTFDGLYVYSASGDNGFTFKGRLALTQAQWPYWSRGIFIGDTVFAVDPDEVKSAPVEEIP
ncbi:MAG: hypothetical protein GXP53_10465 [Deltaproteobacteria bacterium]|nr:hypothetical protein [Deltaproteobacteria bacterium]